MSAGAPLGPKQRFEILFRDGFACVYCGARSPEARLHVDHVVARVNGGTNDDRNLVTACDSCNLGKSAMPLPKRWWLMRSYSIAGMTVEHAIENHWKELTIPVLYELMQVSLSDDSVALSLMEKGYSPAKIVEMHASYNENDEEGSTFIQ